MSEEEARERVEGAFAPLRCEAILSDAGNRLSFRVYAGEESVLQMRDLTRSQFCDEARLAGILGHCLRSLAARGLLQIRESSN